MTRSRAAAFGMAGALALGTIASVGVIAPANAASSKYTCQLTSGPTPLDIVGTMDLPSSAAPGESLTALPTTLGVTLPGALTTILTQLGITDVAGSVTGAEFPIGNTGKSFTSGALTEPGQTLTAGSPAALLGKGTSSGTAPSAPGTYKVIMPSSFTFVPTGGALPPIPCTTNAPVSLGSLVVGDGTATKATSTTVAKLKNAPITKGEHPKIVAKVRTGGDPATGKVIAKEGSKVLKTATLNSKGKAVLKLPVLKAGLHKIVVKYKGNATTKASKDVLKFRTKG
ncbi:MAG: DUF6801 domain-containing protein [Nocardioides sp.]